MFRVMSLALVICAFLAGSALAADLKIGVFNSQAVAMDSDAAKAAQKKLQSQFGAEKDQLEKQAKDLQSKGEALQAQMATLSAKAREEKQMEFMRLRRDFEEKSRNFARKVENSEVQIRQSMARQIYEAVAADSFDASWTGISSMVYKLRRKLGAGIIETVRGHGYKFVAPETSPK